MLIAVTEEQGDRLKCILDQKESCTVNLRKRNVAWVSAADFILARLSDSSQAVRLPEFENSEDGGHVLNGAGEFEDDTDVLNDSEKLNPETLDDVFTELGEDDIIDTD